jgi:uncharacterized protein YheU (UPF0270 family)
MFKSLSKKCLFLLITIALTSCGSGSDEPNTNTYSRVDTIKEEAIFESGDTNSSSGDEAISGNIIRGTAAKGIIKNGIVKIYGLSNGTKDIEPLATGNTDNNGDYSLTVKNYNGPIFVEITADPNSTKMICDITPSCGDIPFGDDINLESDFNIKAVISDLEINQPTTANISAITSLVAARAEAQSRIDSTIISNANSQVADLFGMTGNLSEKPVIDITNEASLIAASEDVLNMAILNSAVASSSIDDGTSITEGLNKLLEDFVVRDGQFLNNGADNEVSIEKIYANAKDILNMNIFSNVEVGKLKETVTLKKAVASAQPVGTASNAMPTEIPEAVYINSAKAMIEDIREFSLQATYRNSQEASVLEDLDLALELVNSDELDNLNEALEIAALAFEEAYLNGVYEQEYNESNQLFEYEYYDFVIPVTVISTNGEHEYSINSEVNSIDFELKATFSSKSDTKSEYGELCEFDEDLYDDNELHTENSNGFFDIEGNLRSRNLEMNNIKGNVSARYNCSYIASLLNSEEIYTWDDYSTGSINLEVEINQTTSNPLTFKGIFELNTELSRSHKNSHHYDNEYYADYDHGDDHGDDHYDDHDEYYYPEYAHSDDQHNDHDHYDDHGDDHDEDYYPEYAHSDDHYDEHGEDYYPEYAHSDDHYDEHGENYYPEYAHSDDHYDEYGEDHYDEHLQAYTANASFLLSGEFEKGDKKIGVTITASVSESEGELWVNGKDLSNENTHNSNTESNSKNFDLAELTDSVEFPDVLNFNGLLIDTKIALGVKLDFTTSASSDITGITLITTNSKGDNREGELTVALGNKRLSFDYSLALEDYQLTVTNQNGTTLKLSDQCYLEKTGCENIGFILVNNEKMATISYDRSNNVAIVTYNNGRSEPLSL